MVFGDHELIHTKRVNRQRMHRDAFKYRMFEATGGYTGYYFGFAFAGISYVLSGVPLCSIVPNKTFLTKAGFRQYMKVGGLYLVLPFMIGKGLGYVAGDIDERKHLLLN